MSDEATTTTSNEDIVAHAGRYYRNARYIICAMLLGAGLWFSYDGWINWPEQRHAFDSLSDEKKATMQAPHSDLDILIQKALAGALIPLSPILLAFFLYRSRGEYRLSGSTLHVPGHPPVPLDSIAALDLEKWKRKGIAYVDYRTGDATRRLTLDDFVYEQIPTDKIVKILEDRFALDEEIDVEARTDAAVTEEAQSEENA